MSQGSVDQYGLSFPVKSLLLAPSPSSRSFAPGDQKQWVPPGDGASISCSKLCCPQTSQMQAFTHPASVVPVSPPSTAQRNFRSKRVLKPPVQLCPLSLRCLQLRCPKEPSRGAQSCNTALAVCHSSYEADLKHILLPFPWSLHPQIPMETHLQIPKMVLF